MSKTPKFEFDRYINGVLMAEGVTIERQPTFDKACVRAAELASYGKNGEIPVLVYRGPSFPAAPEMLKALKDVRYRLYGNGPGDPNIDAAIANAEGTQS